MNPVFDTPVYKKSTEILEGKLNSDMNSLISDFIFGWSRAFVATFIGFPFSSKVIE